MSATFHFKGKQWLAYLIGRPSPDMVSLRYKDEQGIVSFPTRNIKNLRFELSVDEKEIREFMIKKRYPEVAEQLRDLCVGMLPFIDLPNNAMPLAEDYLEALFRGGMHEEGLKFANQVRVRIKTGPFNRKAELVRVMALFELNRHKEARRAFELLKPFERGHDLAPAWLYLKARLELNDGLFNEARESVSRLVAHGRRDFDWFPAGLYYTAAFYVEEDEPEVAKQILRELGIAFPGQRWTQAGVRLLEHPTTRDVSINEYHARYHWFPQLGQPGVSEKSGHSVLLDGRTQHVEIGTQMPFLGSPGQDFSIAAWIGPGARGTVLARANPVSEKEGRHGFLLSHTTFQVQGIGPATRSLLVHGREEGEEGWRHLVAVRDNGDNELRLFVNGKLAVTRAYDRRLNFSHPEKPLLIGAYDAWDEARPLTGFYQGRLDDLQVYDVALNPDSVQRLYQNPGAPAKFEAETVVVDFNNDEGEYPKRRNLRGLRGPIALARINRLYGTNEVAALNLSFGAMSVSVEGDGRPEQWLEVDANERFGDLLFWVNRVNDALPFSRVALREFDPGKEEGYVSIEAFREAVPDGGELADVTSIGKKTYPVSGGRMDLELVPASPAEGFCIYHSDENGERLVESNQPAVRIHRVEFQCVGRALIHYPFDESSTPTPETKAPE